jgi:LysM repeat protein
MLRHFKTIVVVCCALGCVQFGITQEKPTFKDVLLNGKPAKLNVVTGEITLVTAKTEIDSMSTVPQNRTEHKKDTLNVYHLVLKGETLMDISKQYKIPINTLKERNKLETTIVNEGQQLLISGESSEMERVAKTNSNKPSNSAFHMVESGETLYSIAGRYGLSVTELKEMNDLKSNLIAVGQRLYILSETRPQALGDVESVVVKKGDTLFSLAKTYGLSVSEIKRLNNLSNNIIKVGQTLRLK